MILTSYVINASDLETIRLGNKMHKYADDTYLLVPSSNSQLIQDEFDHIEAWSIVNNLRPNRSKSTEMIFSYRRKKSQLSSSSTGTQQSR